MAGRHGGRASPHVGRDSGLAQRLNMTTDPPVSQAQRAAMHAAASGHSTIGIPQKVGKEFSDADKGGKLPEHKEAKDGFWPFGKKEEKPDNGGYVRKPHIDYEQGLNFHSNSMKGFGQFQKEEAAKKKAAAKAAKAAKK